MLKFSYFVNVFPINIKIILCITLFAHGSARAILDCQDSIIRHVRRSNQGKISDNKLLLVVLPYIIKVIVRKLWFRSLWCLVRSLLPNYRLTI